IFWLNGSNRMTFAVAVASARAVAVAFIFGVTVWDAINRVPALFVWPGCALSNKKRPEPKTMSTTTKARVRMVLPLADTSALGTINRPLLLGRACAGDAESCNGVGGNTGSNPVT